MQEPNLCGGSPSGSPASILPSNAWAFVEKEDHSTVEPERDAVLDLVFAAGILAVMTSLLLALGARFGGPPPTIAFLIRFGALLLVPVSLLLVVLLTPGGVIRRSAPVWRLRVGLAIAGLASFAVALVVLNLPLLLIAR